KALTAVERSVNTRRKWAILMTATDLVRQTEHLVAAEASTTQATQLEGLQKAWSSGSLSPLYSPSGASPCGPRSPELASPPPYAGSPLLLRRPMRAFTAPLSTVRDNSPPASPRPARAPAAGSLSPASSSTSSHESETERLQRCIERLRARNQRLTTALERRKGASQQVPPMLGSSSQVDSSALQMALAYCQECEEAYSELLSLYELNKQQGSVVCPAPAPAGDLQLPASPPHRFRYPEAHELSTSFSIVGGAVGVDARSPTGQRREAALRQHIECLKRDRSVTHLPGPGGGDGEHTLILDPGGPLLQSRDGFRQKEEKHARSGRERSLLLDELVTVGEEMAERSAETHLAEEELRCLDWALQALKAQDSPPAHPLPLQRPRAELRRDVQAEPQLLSEQADNGHITRSQKKADLEELNVMFQREHGLKKRLSLVRESLATALRDDAPHRRDSDEHRSRSSRRKYQEQVWRLEQRVAAMSESHQSQMAGLKATVEALESRREETAL
ncbi:hypothetical protein CRUP_024222, partial [Coryphaenoides rupestris]